MNRSTAFACSLLLIACGGDDAPADTGISIDMGTDSVADTAPEDTGPAPMSFLFGPCVEDAQCPGAGFCRTAEDGWPQGSCSTGCVDRTPCDDDVIFHHCIDADGEGGTICEERCLNSVDCIRDGYVCVAQGQITSDSGFCIGYCQTDEDCGGTSECNVHSASCVPAGTVPATGGIAGEACADESACRSGFCIEETRGATANGFLGGMCVGNCVLPPGYNSSNFFIEDTLPSGTCPDEDICFPNGSLTQREAGLCLDACLASTDCRPGYECTKDFQGKTFTNGVCLPIDCAVEDCPAGSTCQSIRRSDGSVVNNCG